MISGPYYLNGEGLPFDGQISYGFGMSGLHRFWGKAPGRNEREDSLLNCKLFFLWRGAENLSLFDDHAREAATLKAVAGNSLEPL